MWQLSWRSTHTPHDTCPFQPALLGPVPPATVAAQGRRGGGYEGEKIHGGHRGTALLHFGLDGLPLLLHLCTQDRWLPNETDGYDDGGGGDMHEEVVAYVQTDGGQGVRRGERVQSREWAVMQRDEGLSGHGTRIEFDSEFTPARILIAIDRHGGGDVTGRVATTAVEGAIQAAEDLYRLDVEEVTRQPWFARLPP
jgi:hypothetical protein